MRFIHAISSRDYKCQVFDVKTLNNINLKKVANLIYNLKAVLCSTLGNIKTSNSRKMRETLSFCNHVKTQVFLLFFKIYVLFIQMGKGSRCLCHFKHGCHNMLFGLVAPQNTVPRLRHKLFFALVKQFFGAWNRCQKKKEKKRPGSKFGSETALNKPSQTDCC